MAYMRYHYYYFYYKNFHVVTIQSYTPTLDPVTQQFYDQGPSRSSYTYAYI